MDDTQWRTHRLELDDQTLREWDAQVLAAGPDGIVLDRSAFYPGGGGQPWRDLEDTLRALPRGLLKVWSRRGHVPGIRGMR